MVGFQTRNPIHKAHEHIQRIGLELCDGLFINPIVGWKKTGDFTQEAVMAAYQRMIEDFYPKARVHIAGLNTQMRYAGPREAVFHAIIRRNLGCTHFIIGRDHAGVGGYYGIPVVPMIDSLRETDEKGSHPVDRSRYMAVQTPQVFHLELLTKAYEQPYSSLFTDDASVVEAMGHAIDTVPGDRENIKITTPFDLLIAEAMFAR